MFSQIKSEVRTGAIHHHFSTIANGYNDLRTTDPEPIALIAKEISHLPYADCADIGCGPGRYDLLLYKHLGDRLCLACVDGNNEMLEELDTYLRRHNISNFRAINSKAESLPFQNGNLDCVFSFNAVHHFNLQSFLQESARILKSGGYLFVYTRLQEQNERNIWGQYFPEFCRKETRLYDLDTFVQSVEAATDLRVGSIEHFRFERRSTLEELCKRAKAKHYSTFSFYPEKELGKAITGFRRNLRSHFKDVERIEWLDENVLFVIQKVV